MSNYVVPRSVSKLEAEIAELEKEFAEQGEQELEQEEEEVVETTSPRPEKEEVELTEEEQTYKKRYGDLRRHSQKLADDLKKVEATLNDLRKQKTSEGLPTAEEAEAWAKANPKAASIIRALVATEASPDREELSQIKEKLSRAEQEARIFKVHADFVEITSDDRFHDWAEEQPEGVKQLVYSTSADDVIWAITQYKREVLSEKPNPKKDAARAVVSSKSTVDPKTKTEGRFSESQVNKMSMSDYEKNEAAITQSQRDGTFIYDLSGAAR